MIYAFDFDSTLTDELLQKFAAKLIKNGDDVWIATMRKDNDFNNHFIKPIIDKLGLSKYRIIFCNGKPKWEYLQGINADIYIDNITDEFEMLKNNTSVVPLLWV